MSELKWRPWQHRFADWKLSAAVPFSKIFVPTPETASLSYLSELLVRNGQHVLLAGRSGSGKTTCLKCVRCAAVWKAFVARDI